VIKVIKFWACPKVKSLEFHARLFTLGRAHIFNFEEQDEN